MGYGKIYETTYFGEVTENGFGKVYFKAAEKSAFFKQKNKLKDKLKDKIKEKEDGLKAPGEGEEPIEKRKKLV